VGQELEESHPQQRRMGKTPSEGQGPPRAIESMMILMMLGNTGVNPVLYQLSLCFIILHLMP
jgi:hypothetical protein